MAMPPSAETAHKTQNPLRSLNKRSGTIGTGTPENSSIVVVSSRYLIQEEHHTPENERDQRYRSADEKSKDFG